MSTYQDSVRIPEPQARARLAKYHSRMAEHAIGAKDRESFFLACFCGTPAQDTRNR